MDQAHAPLCDTLSELLLRARRDGETAPRAVLAMLANLTPNLTLTLTLTLALVLILTLTLTPGDGAHGAGRGGTSRRRGRGRRSHSTDGQGRPPGALTKAGRAVLFPTCLHLTRTFTLTSSPTRTPRPHFKPEAEPSACPPSLTRRRAASTLTEGSRTSARWRRRAASRCAGARRQPPPGTGTALRLWLQPGLGPRVRRRARTRSRWAEMRRGARRSSLGRLRPLLTRVPSSSSWCCRRRRHAHRPLDGACAYTQWLPSTPIYQSETNFNLWKHYLLFRCLSNLVF